jgi:GT2 family glycosyltransferase
MDISVVIVTWNSEEFIGNCLDSISRTADGVQFEIIVVDNSSSDGTVKIVQESGVQIDLVKNRKNLGYAKANNQGIERSQGRYVLLLNPDTEIQEDSLDSMLKFMDANPRVGALGPKLLNPDGSVQPSCREFPRFSTLIWEFFGLSRLFPKSSIFGRWRMGYFSFDRPGDVDQPMGSCLMLRRQTLNNVGPFDENFRRFFNDVDLCYRIKNVGWKIYFHPDARVVHHKGGSTGKAKRRMIWLSHLAFYRFLKKHKAGLANRLLVLLFCIPLFLLALPRMMVKR